MKSNINYVIYITLLFFLITNNCAYSDDNKDYFLSYESLKAKNGLYSEKTYLSRLNSLFGKNKGQSGGLVYHPLENILGNNISLPFNNNIDNSKIYISKEILNDVENYAKERNSLALFIWKDGQLVLRSFFNGINQETLIVGRSLAKPISVMAIGAAINQGYIKSLDQPVSDFISEWKNTKKESILIRHLLDMRSGFLKQGFSKDPEDILNLAYLHPFHDDIIINEYPLTHKPGTRYDYSNATSEMVAPLIERATGKRYAQWLSDELISPIEARGGKIWLNREDGMAHSGCCILLPAETFFKIGLLSHLNGQWKGKKILPTEYINETKKTSPENIWSGLGLYVGEPYKEYKGYANPEFKNLMRTYHSEPYLAKDLYLFDGNANQVIYIIPSKNLVIMRLGNNPPKTKKWDNAYIPNRIMRGMK